MNTCNSINSIALGKLLKKYKLSPTNKQKIILLVINLIWIAQTCKEIRV